jgi:hypothetical protein
MTAFAAPAVHSGELRDAFARASSVLRSVRGRAASLAFAEDPLHLDLPPLLDGSTRTSTATLRLTGTLYLQAELEQSGLIVAAELVVRSRDLVQARDALARKLEEYATAMRGAGLNEFVDPTRRAQLFARLFGVGAGATMSDGAVGSNRAFEQLFASLCVALLRVEAAYRWSPAPDASLDASVRFAARNLLLNIGARQYGVSSLTASRLDQQLRRSIAILGDEDLGALLGVHGVWAVTKWLLGANAPDAGRHAARGAAGQNVLLWLAGVLPAIEDERSTVVLVPPGSAVFAAAARWIVASGLSVPRGPVR